MKKFFVSCFIFLVLLSAFVFATPPKLILSVEAVCCRQHYQGAFVVFKAPNDKGFFAGERVSNEEPRLINLNSLSECCDYSSDKNACLSCIKSETEKQEREKVLEKSFFIGATALAVILILLIIIFSVLKIKKDGKEFYGLSWGKIPLMLAITGIPGFFLLSISTGGQMSSILYMLFILLFWPFLVILGFEEKLLFGYVDWTNPIGVPLMILTFVVNVVYIYLLASLIISIFKRKR